MAHSARQEEWNFEEGFSHPPDVRNAYGGETIFRAHGGSSQESGNCFFTPAVEGALIGSWTAELLERELNAALWGNDFEVLTRYCIKPGVPYKIGAIAHDRYAGLDFGRTFEQRAFLTPSGIFRQVTFFWQKGDTIDKFTLKGQSLALAPGRYAREASQRAKRFNQ